jgi:hypothetical protein
MRLAPTLLFLSVVVIRTFQKFGERLGLKQEIEVGFPAPIVLAAAEGTALQCAHRLLPFHFRRQTMARLPLSFLRRSPLSSTLP